MSIPDGLRRVAAATYIEQLVYPDGNLCAPGELVLRDLVGIAVLARGVSAGAGGKIVVWVVRGSLVEAQGEALAGLVAEDLDVERGVQSGAVAAHVAGRMSRDLCSHGRWLEYGQLVRGWVEHRRCRHRRRRRRCRRRPGRARVMRSSELWLRADATRVHSNKMLAGARALRSSRNGRLHIYSNGLCDHDPL